MTGLVAIIDDDDAIRDAISLMLESVGIRTCGYAAALDFIEDPAASACQCLIMDVRMPGLSGSEAQRRLNASGSRVPIIFITGHGEVEMAVEAMKNGAFEFLQKPFKDQLLIDAVQSALTRWGDAQAIDDQHGEFRRRLARLTPRERDVFNGVARGQRGKQIAADLGVATKTVEEYRARVFEKMHVKTGSELAAMAAKHGAIKGRSS